MSSTVQTCGRLGSQNANNGFCSSSASIVAVRSRKQRSAVVENKRSLMITKPLEQDQVLNVYSYREEYVPRRAPQGKLFYIVTPNPEVANRKYLYRLKRNIETRTCQPVFAPFRKGCLSFDNIDLASSYCKLVRDTCTDGNRQFYIVMEAGAREVAAW